MMVDFWENRYWAETYAYGTQPNRFFQAMLDKLEPGRLLLPAEGEGRNAVYAARKGWAVTAVDFSPTARQKALNLANDHKVVLDYQVLPLNEFRASPGSFDVVAFIFAHMPPAVRALVHQRATHWVKKSGYVLLEAFHKRQLGRPSGGPTDESWLYSTTDLADDFAQLDLLTLRDQMVMLDEGLYHQGDAAVVQLVARKP